MHEAYSKGDILLKTKHIVSFWSLWLFVYSSFFSFLFSYIKMRLFNSLHGHSLFKSFSTISGFRTIFVELSALVFPFLYISPWYSIACESFTLGHFLLSFYILILAKNSSTILTFGTCNLFCFRFFFFWMHKLYHNILEVILAILMILCNSVHPLVDALASWIIYLFTLWKCIGALIYREIERKGERISPWNYCFQSNELCFETILVGIHMDHILLLFIQT